jgi:hypothetical protein
LFLSSSTAAIAAATAASPAVPPTGADALRAAAAAVSAATPPSAGGTAAPPSPTDNIVELNAGNPSAVPPTRRIIKPTKSVDIEALRADLTPLENNLAAAQPSIPVGKPGPFEWFRTHPDPAYRPVVYGVDFEPPGTKEKEFNLVAPNMVHIFAGTKLLARYQLYVLKNRVDELRICQVKLQDGKPNEWHRTKQMAMEKAISGWVRMESGHRHYVWTPAPTPFPDPDWPDLTINELLQIALGDLDRIVDRLDHPIVRIIRGDL